MSLIKDIFTPKPFLPVQITPKAMEMLEASLETTKANNTLFIEIGDDRESTGSVAIILDKYFPDLLNNAIEEKCEYISFYI
jgi:hypothetical protein